MSSWKAVQSRKEKFKKTKLALIVLGLIILLIIISQLNHFAKFLVSPMAKSDRAYRWDRQFNINLIWNNQLLSYNPKDQKITIIKIPD